MLSLDKKQRVRRCRVVRCLRTFSFRHDDGYAIAEFAVVLPVLVMISLGLFSVLGLGATQISLNARCAEVTRIIARGDEIPESFTLDGATAIEVNRHDGILDVKLSRTQQYSFLLWQQDFIIHAHASALDEMSLQ